MQSRIFMHKGRAMSLSQKKGNFHKSFVEIFIKKISQKQFLKVLNYLAKRKS